MSQKSPIENKAIALVNYLKKEGLLQKEDEFTAQLLRELTIEFNNAANSAQRASISKEIRETVRMLPRPSRDAHDPSNDFLTELADA